MAGARTSRSWAAGRPRRWATTTPAITPDEQAAGDAETPFPHGEVLPVPVMVNDTLDLVELFGVDQGQPAYLQSVFSHDTYVVKVGQRYVMHMSYWDGGYVLLDVTDPRPGQVSLIAESDYALLDEERLLARGQEIAPEGNAHQSELSADRTYLVATDEDFNPFAVTGTIETGPTPASCTGPTPRPTPRPSRRAPRSAAPPPSWVWGAAPRIRGRFPLAPAWRSSSGVCALSRRGSTASPPPGTAPEPS